MSEKKNQLGIGQTTLRDYFAAQALIGLIFHSKTREGRNHPDESMDNLVKNSYAIADKMLAEREQEAQA